MQIVEIRIGKIVVSTELIVFSVKKAKKKSIVGKAYVGNDLIPVRKFTGGVWFGAISTY